MGTDGEGDERRYLSCQPFGGRFAVYPSFDVQPPSVRHFQGNYLQGGKGRGVHRGGKDGGNLQKFLLHGGRSAVSAGRKNCGRGVCFQLCAGSYRLYGRNFKDVFVKRAGNDGCYLCDGLCCDRKSGAPAAGYAKGDRILCKGRFYREGSGGRAGRNRQAVDGI